MAARSIGNLTVSFGLVAIPVNLPLRAWDPATGTKHAIGTPCLVISTLSPPATSSSKAMSRACASVAVTLLIIPSV